MASYHIQRVNGYGPYLRKAEYIGDDEHHWDHLGPLHSVDPAVIPDDVVASIREEGYGLARYRDNQTAEIHRKDVANAIRDEFGERWGDDVLADVDDRRSTEIELDEDAPRAAERLLGEHAADARAEVNEGSGQAPLTDDELKAIDWTKKGQNVMHARAAKAALHDEGVSDWRMLYSGDIESDGWDDVAEENRESMSGERTDSEESSAPETSAAKARSQMEKRAVEAVEEGYDEAETALREDHGWTDADFESEFGEVPA
jgi:hypothetical protein